MMSSRDDVISYNRNHEASLIEAIDRIITRRKQMGIIRWKLTAISSSTARIGGASCCGAYRERGI